MNNQNINKLLEDALSTDAVGEAFKEQVLRDSTAVLIRGRVLRKRFRAAGLTLAILLAATAAFTCGRMSAPDRITDRQAVVHTVGDKNNDIKVSRELVAWLDAARFFTKLGMNERAVFSYKKASELIPHEMPDSQQTGFGPKNVLAGILPDYESVRGHSQEIPERIDSETVLSDHRDKLEPSQNILSKIIAQNFGG